MVLHLEGPNEALKHQAFLGLWWVRVGMSLCHAFRVPLRWERLQECIHWLTTGPPGIFHMAFP